MVWRPWTSQFLTNMKKTIKQYFFTAGISLAIAVNVSFMAYRIYNTQYDQAWDNANALLFLVAILFAELVIRQKEKYITDLLNLIKWHEELEGMYESINSDSKKLISMQKAEIGELQRDLLITKDVLSVYQEKQVKKPVVKKKNVQPVADVK